MFIDGRRVSKGVLFNRWSPCDTNVMTTFVSTTSLLNIKHILLLGLKGLFNIVYVFLAMWQFIFDLRSLKSVCTGNRNQFDADSNGYPLFTTPRHPFLRACAVINSIPRRFPRSISACSISVVTLVNSFWVVNF